MHSEASTVEDYLKQLPDDRRAAIEAVRATVLDHLPPGYEEGIGFGMISWHIPLERYPDTYNGQPLGIAALASQKRYMSLYLHCVYADGDERTWFRRRWEDTGRRLDMGKSCVRFRRLEDIPLDVVGEAIGRVPVEEHIARYERSRS